MLCAAQARVLLPPVRGRIEFDVRLCSYQNQTVLVLLLLRGREPAARFNNGGGCVADFGTVRLTDG